MKKAKLIYTSFVIRIVVEEDTPEHEMLDIAEECLIKKIKLEGLSDHLVGIKVDKECPFGSFHSDNVCDKCGIKPVSDTQVIKTKKKA